VNSPAVRGSPVPSAASATAGPRQQVELGCLSYRRAPAVDPELGVDVLGVGAQGVQGHAELTRDVGAVEVGGEEPEHVQFALAQGLDEPALSGRRGRAAAGGPVRPVAGVHEPPDVADSSKLTP
jgi:hypothetical protein